ncbi:MAG: T9SS type A sorting domain-containing protein [Chitinophagales bacterium]
MEKNGIVIPGATSINYAATKSGNYSVVVTANCDVTETPFTAVTVWPRPIAEITHASPADLCNFHALPLYATTGAGYVYKWYKGATLIPGATTDTYVATTPGNYKVQITNAFGCFKTSASVMVYNSCKLYHDTDTEINIYPSPATSELNITGIDPNETYNIIITDASVRAVLNIQSTGNSLLDISTLPGGYYLISIIDENGFDWRGRFVKN